MNGVTDALKWLDVVKYDVCDYVKNGDELANILSNMKLNDVI